MCEPATLAAIFSVSLETATTVSTVATAASTGLAAYGAYTQASTAKAIAESNAAEGRRAADDARTRGEKAAIEARQKGQQIEGAQRASMASRGLDLNEGTPDNILGQTDFFTQSDVATARTNGRREARGYQVQAANYDAQAAGINPGLALAGTLLGGGAKVADKWYSNRKSSFDGYGGRY